MSDTVAHTAFADPGLETAVRAALKQPRGQLREADLVGFEELDASGRVVVDLSGIGRLKNLEQLRLARNRVEDLSPLSGLDKLRILDLVENRVSDLSPLSELRQLTI